MKNTLTINHLNSGSVDLVNRLDTGTNEFLLEVTGGRGATITFDGGNAVSVTSDDFIYSVSSSLWVGSNSLSINISDGTISYTLTVNKIDQLTGDIYIQKDSETEFTLVKKQDSKRELLDFFYPVGSYYESSDTTFDPNVTWGGTWELEDEGLVHVSAGENYAVSGNAQDGGAKTINLEHSHTVNSHNHSLPFFAERANTSNINSYQPWNFSSATSASKVHAANRWTLSRTPQATAVDAYQMYSGSSSPGTNNKLSKTQSIMQPYKIVNRWHRVA